MSAYFLRTARLGLRRWREDDLDCARALWGDPAVTLLIDARGPLTDAQIAERLSEEIAQERDHGMQYWPLFLLDGGTFVGCCGLRPYRIAAHMPELGVHIRRGCWRRGFALEAAEAVIDHAFGVLGQRALFAGHHPDNVPSRRLLERLGFRYTHDEHYAATAREHPSYVLTAADRDRRRHSAANEARPC